MAFRRNLGGLADLLLRSHLARRQATYESDLQARRQAELSAQNMRQRILEKALGDPKFANSLPDEMLGGIPKSTLLPSREENIQAAQSGIDKARDLTDLPDPVSLRNNYLAQPGAEMVKPGPTTVDPTTGLNKPNESAMEPLLASLQARRASMENAAPPVNRDYVDPNSPEGTKLSVLVNPFKDIGTVRQTEATGAQEGIKEGHKLEAENPFKINTTNLFNKGTQSSEASKAGAIAGAQETARQKAEWLDPKVVAAKLDFETKKAMNAVVAAADRQTALELAKRNTAVKALLPTYQEYRKTAIQVLGNVDNPEALAAIQGTLSKLPWGVGQFVGSAMETVHGVTATVLPPNGDPRIGQEIIKLNRLTDTLAQGMANAVLGNRGQTTENDRMTAKNILVNSLTGMRSAADLINLTDKMFTILPTVSAKILAQDPNAEPAVILQAAADQAKADQAPAGFVPAPQGAPQTPQTPSVSTNSVPPQLGGGESLDARLARLRANRARQ